MDDYKKFFSFIIISVLVIIAGRYVDIILGTRYLGVIIAASSLYFVSWVIIYRLFSDMKKTFKDMDIDKEEGIN